MATIISASDNHGGAENFGFLYLILMILYYTSHEIVLHQTSVFMWNNEKMKIVRPTKFSASAECVGVENVNAIPSNRWRIKPLIMVCRQYDDSVECNIKTL
jgi:hypothetical protein